MPTGSPRSTCSWFRRSHFGCYTDCSFSDTAGGELCGLASPRIPLPNGSLAKSREACGWEAAPTYLVRDRDRVYGEAFTRRIRAMGIRDRPTAPRSPWQNGYAERLIGSIRRECLDHVIIIGERHLRHVLRSYQQYYNGTRTHLSLAKDSPLTRSVQAGREHSSAADPRRIAPSLRPDLISDRHSLQSRSGLPRQHLDDACLLRS